MNDDAYSVDACEEAYRVAYWHYRNDPATDSERMLTAAEYVQWMKDAGIPV